MPIFVSLLATAIVAGGCRQVVASKPDSGTSAFRFVDPPSASRQAAVLDLDEPMATDRFKEAVPIPPLTTPVYPAKALAAKAGLVNIGVRIVVDADGRVTEVSPSLLTFSTPTKYADLFQEAVRLAVMTWRFRPAQRYYFEIGQAGDGEIVPKFLRKENTETFFDLSFTFTASGTVLSGTPSK